MKTRIASAAALALCLLAVLALFAVLRLGLVAEDFQFALKGAKIAEHPLELLQPFQLVWRPAVYALFALVWAAGPVAVWYRAVQLAAGLALAAAGWGFLRRVAGLGPWLAAAAVVVWLASPLASEPLCGEASFVGHLLFAGSVLLALWIHAGEPSPLRRVGVALALLVAAACKEEWIVVPIMLLAEDLALRGRSLREMLRGALWWMGAAAGYLAAYDAITHFRYSGFYHPGVKSIAAKALYTLVSFLQLAEPLPGGSGRRWRTRRCGRLWPSFCSARWSSSPRCGGCGDRSCSSSAWAERPPDPGRGRPGGALDAAAVVLLPRGCCRVVARERARAVAAVAVARVRRAAAARGRCARCRDDPRGSGRLGQGRSPDRCSEQRSPAPARRGGQGSLFGRAAPQRLGPLGGPGVKPRGAAEGLLSQTGRPLWIVSLSALLSWQTYRRGWVLERVQTLPEGAAAAAFVHITGGFRRLAGVPPVEVRHPLHPQRGAPGVILMPRPWAGFAPREFP